MKVTCDNCGAVYRIPEEKLTKEVSRATCKRCGNKIVIRKPSAIGSSLGSSYSFDDDDDGVVNHEERTVIATVPELQKFDATPPLSVPGGPSDDGSSDDDVLADDETEPAAAAKPAATEGQAALSTANPLAATPGNNASANALSGVSLASTAKLDVGPIPMAMLGLSILGSLLFISNYAWSTSYLTAAGFFLALFGQVAALMAVLDLSKQRRPRPALVFGVPAAVCVGVFLLLLAVQGKENMAFLDLQKAEKEVLDDAVASIEWEYKEVIDEETGEVKTIKVRKPPRARRPSGVPDPISPDTADASLEDQPVGAKGAQDLLKEMGIGAMPSRPAGVPGEDRIADQRDQLKQRNAINAAKADARKALADGFGEFTKCWERYGAGGDPAKVGQLSVTILPSGKMKSAALPGSSSMKNSKYETCLESEAQKLNYPSFDAPEPITVQRKLF